MAGEARFWVGNITLGAKLDCLRLTEWTVEEVVLFGAEAGIYILVTTVAHFERFLRVLHHLRRILHHRTQHIIILLTLITARILTPRRRFELPRRVVLAKGELPARIVDTQLVAVVDAEILKAAVLCRALSAPVSTILALHGGWV